MLTSLLARARLRLRRYGGDSQAKMTYWRDRLKADYFASTNAPEQIEKSRQIAAAVAEHCPGTRTLHELGVGAGRNIRYLLERLPDVRYSGNDLDREACLHFAEPEVVAALEFVERDTLSFLRDQVEAGRTVDVVLAADHLIHVPPDSIPDILALLQLYAARHVVLRESVRRLATRQDDFWYLHDFAALGESFELVREEECDPVHFAEYSLRVYRRRDL